MYIIRQDTGIYINPNTAKHIAECYLADKGYMYTWATLYNIPWALLYAAMPLMCYKTLVKKDSETCKALSSMPEVRMSGQDKSKYMLVEKNGGFLDLKYFCNLHEKIVTENDTLEESIGFGILKPEKGNEETKILWDERLYINENRFLNLITSEKAKEYRSQEYLNITQKLFSDL